MSDVVDSDELLRRIQRARDWAEQEERRWKTRKTQSDDLEIKDPNGPPSAEILASAYEAVRKVLDEVIEPGTNDVD